MINMNKILKKVKESPNIILNGFSETNEYDEFLPKARKYIIFEYKNRIFKIIQENGIKIFGYSKETALQMIKIGESQIQNGYEINKFIKNMIYNKNEENHIVDYIVPELAITYGGQSVWSFLKNNLAGNLEKEVLNHLKFIEMVRNSGGYKVLRFWHYNGKDWFDFEVNSRRITG